MGSLAPRPAGPSRLADPERTHTDADCLIIGGGQNGLSVAAALQEQGVQAIVLEQHGRIGDQWRARYERLHLHHITDVMHLPGVRYPRSVHRYPSRIDVANHLEAFAALNDLDVRLQHAVQRLEQQEDGSWVATVQSASENDDPIRFTAAHVVLSAGVTGITPVEPEISGREHWSGRVLHSRDYFNADAFEDQRVLIVGSGNSAVEIACDLVDHQAEVTMLMRSANAWVTRESFVIYHRLLAWGGPVLTYVPFLWLLAPPLMLLLDVYFKLAPRMRYGDMSSFGVRTEAMPPMLRMALSGGRKAPTYVDGTWGEVGDSIFDLIRAGRVPIHTHEIAELVAGTRSVRFTDGSEAEFDAILLCTGFHPVLAHYATFLDRQLVKEMLKPGVFRPLEELPGIKGLWPSLGGFSGTRYAQQVLAARLAARIQNRPAPKLVLPPFLSYWIGGIDAVPIRIPRRTLAIHAITVLVLLAHLL